MTYSTVLAFTAAILLIIVGFEKKLKYKLFYIFFFLSATANLFLNGGRTGQLIYIVVIIMVSLSLVKHKLKALLSAIATLFLVFFLSYQFSPNFNDRTQQLYHDLKNMTTMHDYTGSAATRIALTIVGLHTIKDNFFLGTGISYNMTQIEEYSKELDYEFAHMQTFADYHSTFFTISAQLGLTGIIISILIIYSLFNFKNLEIEYKIMSLTFATTFVLFSFSHNTLHTMNPMIFFALFAGLFNSLSMRKVVYEHR